MATIRDLDPDHFQKRFIAHLKSLKDKGLGHHELGCAIFVHNSLKISKSIAEAVFGCDANPQLTLKVHDRLMLCFLKSTAVAVSDEEYLDSAIDYWDSGLGDATARVSNSE
ncbi:MAG: hypothetical protein ACYTEQ_05315 [Planctomycetota bacterium]